MEDRLPQADVTQADISRLFQPATLPDEDARFYTLQLVLVPTGMSVELTKADQVMGRHSSVDIRLPLADVSRRHCRFIFTAGNWKVIDLDSLNGIHLNDEPVKEAVLKHGDHLRVGSFVFEIRFPGAPTLAGSRPTLRRAS